MDAEQLISAIRAALDETERIAREATCEAWTVSTDVYVHGEVVTAATHAAYVGDKNPRPYGVVVHGDFHEAVKPADAEHIAHNDPAAVLRRVAADRELLQAYEEQRAWMEPHYSDDQYNGGLYEGLLTAVRALARGLGINPEEETDQ